jgi:hypothetical protein
MAPGEAIANRKLERDAGAKSVAKYAQSQFFSDVML